MDCYVGAASGALKGLNFKKSTATNLNDCRVCQLNPIVDEITAICFAHIDEEEKDDEIQDCSNNFENQVVLCRLDRYIRLYNARKGTWRNFFKLVGGSGPIRGVQFAKRDTDTKRLVTGVDSGDVRVFDLSQDFLQLNKENANEAVVESNLAPEPICVIKAGSNLAEIRLHPSDSNLLATGGFENGLKVWDLDNSKTSFVSKNVSPDMLQLRVPVYETSFRFLDFDGNCIVTTTGTHRVRLYDIRAQRRPVAELEWLDTPIRALSTCSRANHILAGNSTGELGLFDLRVGGFNKIAAACKYRGFAGSIRSIEAHASAPIFASCGIDRFVIVHDLNTRAILKKIKMDLDRLIRRCFTTICKDWMTECHWFCDAQDRDLQRCLECLSSLGRHCLQCFDL